MADSAWRGVTEADNTFRSPGKQGGVQSNAGVDDIHFTPSNPFAVRGGIAVYF